METQTILPRKERERQARREQILNAARKVFSERGFEKATLDEIAVAAEFGKGTIYNYFKSKEELFTCIIERGINRFQQFVAQAIQNITTPREKVETYIDSAFEFFEKHRQIFSILELERNNLARSLNDGMFSKCCEQQAVLLQFLAQLFNEGIKAGEFKKLDSLKLAQALFGLIHVAFFHAIREPETSNLKKDAKLIKQIFFEGVARIQQ
ncbi:MAG: TetR/AcrR family transcriptional regulator [bacterium]